MGWGILGSNVFLPRTINVCTIITHTGEGLGTKTRGEGAGWGTKFLDSQGGKEYI